MAWVKEACLDLHGQVRGAAPRRLMPPLHWRFCSTPSAETLKQHALPIGAEDWSSRARWRARVQQARAHNGGAEPRLQQLRWAVSVLLPCGRSVEIGV